jgi:glycolate oxidase FAD binding subunit
VVDLSAATIAIDGLTPAAHARPESAEAFAAALREANEAGQAVAPLGGGTQLDLGSPPSHLDLALETTALDRVVEYEPADLTVTVEAGIRFAELQRLLGEQGQFLALDPPADERATIGGLIATNASGPLRFSSGTARDLVLGCRIANPDGALTRAGGRVVKNVAGYDLNKLYIGSLGTLGAFVELSFKLAPIPPASATLAGSFADSNAARQALAEVVRSPLAPLAIELLAGNAPAIAGLGQPQATGRVVVFRVGGYPQAVERQVRDLGALVQQHGGQRLETPDSLWDDLAQMRREAQQRAVVLKAAAPISASSALVDHLERALTGLQPIVWAHAGNGVAYAACDAPPTAEVIVALRRDVGALGENASLVVQRCPTELKRTLDVWGDPGSSLALMRTLKAKLDPRNTLNPGRYVGGI